MRGERMFGRNRFMSCRFGDEDDVARRSRGEIYYGHIYGGIRDESLSICIFEIRYRTFLFFETLFSIHFTVTKPFVLA